MSPGRTHELLCSRKVWVDTMMQLTKGKRLLQAVPDLYMHTEQTALSNSLCVAGSVCAQPLKPASTSPAVRS